MQNVSFQSLWSGYSSYSVDRWAGSIARQAKSGMKPQLQQEMEQECYMKLWEDLASDGPTFLLESFTTSWSIIFVSCRAESDGSRRASGKRSGVEEPRASRVGRWRAYGPSQMGEGELPLAARLVSYERAGCASSR